MEDRTPSAPDPEAAAVFSAGGELARLCREKDWSQTPLGPVDAWPASLKTLASTVVAAASPMIVLWGPQYIQIYNDGYRDLMGERHPAGLGQPNLECWPEVAEFNLPIYTAVRERGERFTFQDQALTIARHGHQEQAYFNLSFSPAPADDGGVGGVLVSVLETTAAVRARQEAQELNERLARQAALFEAVLEQLPAGVSVAEAPSGRGLYHNREAVRLLGHELVPGQDFSRYEDYGAQHPDGRPYSHDEYPTVRALHHCEVTRGEEMHYRRGDGTLACLSVSGSPVYDADDRMIAAVSSFFDIGHQKRLQDELARAAGEADLERRRLRTLLDVLPVGVWLADAEGQIVMANPAAARLWGGDAPLVDDPGHYHEEYRAWWPDGRPLRAGDWGLARALRGEASGPEEVEIAGFDGSRRTILNYGVPIRDAEGRLAGAVATTLDITERKRIEQALAHSEQRFRHMADHAPVMVWVTDPHGYCTYLSRSWYEYTGQEPDQGLGLGWVDAVHPQDREQARQAFLRASATHSPFRFEYRLQHSDGGYRWAIDAAAPWFGEDGEFLGFIGSVFDITERKQAEGAMQRLNADLEQRVQEEIEARQQAQEQLLQAQKMESLGQLTGGVAHDFNNILAATITSLELALRRTDETGATVRLLENALRAARRGGTLVDQLLTFARKQRLEPRPCDLSALIASFEELLRRAVGAAVKVRLELAEDLWLVRSDVGQFENAVLNLAMNARDAMPEGGTLRIVSDNIPRGSRSLPADLEPGDYVRLQVIDTGAGMPPEVAARAFDPFYTTKPPGKGTGLGLSQVYGFAKQSGGTAAIESRPGKGTCICLYLPRTEELLLPEPRGAGDQQLHVPAGTRMLVVDDDPAVRGALEELLADLGLMVSAAATPLQGLAMLAEQAPAAVLADYAMPGMPGTEFIRRARETRPELPCLLVTGYVGDAAEREAPMDIPILRKPFSTTELVIALNRLLAAGP